MKKRIKLVVPIILIFVLILSFTSCSILNRKQGEYRINNYLNEVQPIQLLGRDLNVTYNDELVKNTTEKLQELITATNEGKMSEIKYVKLFNKYYSYFDELYTNYNYLEILTEVYGTDEYYDLKEKCYKDFIQASVDFDNVRCLIAKSVYRSTIFSNSTDEEIDNFVENIEKGNIEESSILTTEINNYKTQTSKGEITSVEMYMKCLPLYQQIAQLNGYDNYMEYAYNDYFSRSYTVEDSLLMIEMVMENLVPLYKQYETLMATQTSNLSKENIQELLIYNSGFFGRYKGIIDDYASFLGGNYLKNYNNLWSSGNYFFSNRDNSTVTAYQTRYSMSGESYIFFSKNYQDVSTFIHEFGHMNAASSNTIQDLDLLETQSQGNEVLFAYYLDYYNCLNEQLEDYNMNNLVFTLLKNIVRANILNQLEYYIFTNANEMTVDKIEFKYEELCSKYGYVDNATQLENKYWARSITFNPLYYISYSTSAFAALSVYTIAQTKGINEAKDSYIKCTSYSSTKENFSEVLSYSGLLNPFNIIDISQLTIDLKVA